MDYLQGSLCKGWCYGMFYFMDMFFFFPKKLYGYVDYGFSQEALMCLHITQLQNQAPSDATLVSILKAHGGLGVVDRLHQTHMEIIEKGFEREILVNNMLVDTYGKFGSTK